MAAKDAKTALAADGYTADINGGAIYGGDSPVTAQSPEGGTELEPYGQHIFLTVEDPNAESDSTASAQPEPSETTEPEKATTGGLTETYAMTACDQYGEQQFPYGYDAHWVIGVLANEYQPDTDEWYFKVEADVTNEYNAKQTVNIECYVTGTEDAPIVNDFLAY